MPATAIVVGAGIAGLACARTLQEAGLGVRVIDKGRGPGGRIATRRLERGGLSLAWDHGAQYATARSPAFAAAIAPSTAPWPAAGAAARVGTPGMSALARALAHGLTVEGPRTVTAIEPVGRGWRVTHVAGDLVRGTAAGEAASDEVDLVAVAVPAPQAVQLLPAGLAERARQAVYAPSWTVLTAWEQPPDAADATLAEGAAVQWAAHDRSKPGRTAAASTWVLQASAAWTTAHLERPADEVAQLLLREWPPALRAGEPIALMAHRWRYAFAERVADSSDARGFALDASGRIGACGDAFAGSRLEDAWASGRDLATALLGAASP